MKKLFLYALTIAALLAFSFSSCKKPKEETTVAEDKANIQKSFTQLKNLAQNFRSGSFYRFVEDFVGIGEYDSDWYQWVGEGNGDYTQYEEWKYVGDGNGEYIYNEEWDYYEWVGYGNGNYIYEWGWKYTPGTGDYNKVTETYWGITVPEFTVKMVDELVNILPIDNIADEGRFNMAEFSGKYTWNNSTQKWNKTVSNNTIQILFPANATGTNNCDLGVTSYTDKLCDIYGNTIYLPTKLNSYFTKNGEKLAGVDLTASFTNYGIPQNVNVNVYAKPLAISTTLKQESASRYAANVSVKDETNSANSLSVNGEITFTNNINSYSDFDDFDINYMKCTITQHNLTIDGTIDFKQINGFFNIFDASVSQINSSLNVNVLYENKKIGTLGVEEVGKYKDRYVFIYYSDGTKDNTRIFYQDFLDDIINIFIKK